MMIDLSLFEQLTTRSHGSFGLPQRGPAVVAERVERPDVGEGDELVAAEAGASDEVVDRGESSFTARGAPPPLAEDLALERRLSRSGVNARARLPVVRAGVAEPAIGIDALEHRFVVAAAFGTSRTKVLRYTCTLRHTCSTRGAGLWTCP
jgi:hypothetical protein